MTKHPSRTVWRRARLWTALVASAAAVTAGLGGCGSGTAPAPTISVVTTLWPLAQAVSAVGGATVKVIDLATPGVNPRTQTLSPAQVTEVEHAAVVFDVGGGFQPAIENAVASARSVVSLAPRFGPATDGAWLDPVTMQRLDPLIAKALTAANPAAASNYANSEKDFYEQLSSAGIDFQTALTSCPEKNIAGPDATLQAVASEYHLRLHQLGDSAAPSPAEVSRAAAVISASHAAVFSEPWVSDATVRAAAGQSGARVRSLKTLETPPPGTGSHNTYVALVQTDLAILTAGLGCNSVDATES